jgi:hypothetical protein
MNGLADILRSIGLFLLLILSRIAVLLVGLVLLAGAAATAVGSVLGVGRVFHLAHRSPATRENSRRPRFRFHR